MRGRDFFIIALAVFGAVAIFHQSVVIKGIAGMLGFLCFGIFLGISIKDTEIKYKTGRSEFIEKETQRKEEEEDFLKSLEVE